MMNSLGKLLVLAHVFLSLVAFTIALALFFLAPDWGRLEPRSDDIERLPSELDKRIAAVKQAEKARDTAVPPVKVAQDELFAAMNRYYKNHLFYREELARLRSGAGAIQAKGLKYTAGVLELEPKGIGVPVLDQDIPGIEKSYEAYRRDLLDKEEGVFKKIAELTEALAGVIAKHSQVTAHLQGLNPMTNKKDRLGLYDLLDHELTMQHRIRAEMAYLQPQWAQSLEDAQSYAERRARLQETLDRLKETLKDQGKSK
jgi:hypothetical protein